VLAFEGTDLPEAIILRSVLERNGFVGAAVSLIATEVSWFRLVASSRFAISAPIFQVLPVIVKRWTRETDSGERNPRAQKRRGGKSCSSKINTRGELANTRIIGLDKVAGWVGRRVGTGG
jgi:hypothetical protein